MAIAEHDERSEWQKRIGVGERQPRDGHVSDTTRTRTWSVENQIVGGTAGTQTEHRSGRVDARVNLNSMPIEKSVTAVNPSKLAGYMKKEIDRGRK